MHNSTMSSVYRHFSEIEGVYFSIPVPGFGFNGSTDMGNVSLVVPSIHPGYSLGGHCRIHTRDFEELAGKPEVQQYALIAAKSMALTCTELFLNQDLRERVKHEFQKRIKEFED
ncbi:hypothetical protein RvY_00792 [Ramazzottius varieornatus]|uniref:Peptidase M20 dimerisation domain-containing protein n=1 Tax=Ramazzottius varieornatus TaxID=947166 RepID=A0A1D1UE06_RAMVA|nr:hypothetical protein RvY_00792 [Ramazzottius varieornatus]